MTCRVCLQNPQSAEGSSDALNIRKGKVLCDDRFLALRDGIRIVGIRGCGLGMTKETATHGKGEKAKSCAALDSSPFATASGLLQYGVAGSERQPGEQCRKMDSSLPFCHPEARGDEL